ncbi:hypothetical protein [Sulfuricurvum sp.]|uniref:hypothetical protein n=1 Tax=Sulfuricurvum sp. TaxID=2025608 RepID=UPI00286DC2D4|nr:hypothetical protein [Sulfuricurvum sp.]
MRAILLSVISAIYLYGANGDPQSLLNEVAKLREKYEECRQEQSLLSSSDAATKIKGYQKRIAHLENQIKQNDSELLRIKERNTQIAHELSQKKGVIQSLEKSLTSKDQKYLEATVQNERLLKETNTIKVGKVERENLKRALVKAKMDAEKLEKSMGKTDKDVMALRSSLAEARAEIEKLRSRTAPIQSTAKAAVPASVQERVVEKIVYKDRPVIQEKIVTKVVEPTEKIIALQKELASAQATIANLKNSATGKTIVKEKIVEKIVYKDRPVVQEKIVTKVVEPTDKIKALQTKLAQNEAQLAKLKAQPQKPTPPKTTKVIAAAPEKVQKVAQESKVSATIPATPKKGGSSSAYRMASNAPIYNAPGGSVVDTWEERRSFTAGNPSGGWVHITGYFVNRVWQRTAEGENLYVRESDVIRR